MSVRRFGRAVLSLFAAALVVGASVLLLSATANAAPGNGNANGHSANHANGNGQSNGQSNGKAHQLHTAPQPPSNADFTGRGANTHGPYDSTRDGSPSMNGNGKGDATGKPCAGCVGKADNKNPPGQLPGGPDANSGYECDRNHGVGRTNPAHTGCRPDTPVPPNPPGECPSGTPPVNGECGGGPGGGGPGGGAPGTQPQPGPVPPAASSEADAEAGLAFTGSPVLLLLQLAAAALAAGAGFVLAGRVLRRPDVS